MDQNPNNPQGNSGKKQLPNHDELEVKALGSFRKAWESFGFSKSIPVGGEIMPRRFYAASMAKVVHELQTEYGHADSREVVYAVLQTVLGNASQLGAKLTKGDSPFLAKASAEQTADDLLAKLRG